MTAPTRTRDRVAVVAWALVAVGMAVITLLMVIVVAHLRRTMGLWAAVLAAVILVALAVALMRVVRGSVLGDGARRERRPGWRVRAGLKEPDPLFSEAPSADEVARLITDLRDLPALPDVASVDLEEVDRPPVPPLAAADALLRFDPVIDLYDRRVVGFVLRLSEPRGAVPLLRGTDDDRDRLLLDHLCRRDGMSRRWLSVRLRDGALGPALIASIDRAVRDSGRDPETLVLEITGRRPLTETEAEAAHRLVDQGIGLAVDGSRPDGAPVGIVRTVPLRYLHVDHRLMSPSTSARPDARATGEELVGPGVAASELWSVAGEVGCEIIAGGAGAESTTTLARLGYRYRVGSPEDRLR